MKRWVIGCVLALAGTTAVQAQDEPLDPPIARLDLHVEQEAYGQCANLVAGAPGRTPLLRWNGVCHGWRTFSCGDRVLLVQLGVRVDEAILIFEHENRTGDPMALIGREIARKWPGNEILRLRFGDANCNDGAFVLPFDGAYAPSKGGSGHGMKGSLTFRTPDHSSVNIRPAN